MSVATNDIPLAQSDAPTNPQVVLDFVGVYQQNFQFVWSSLRGLGVPSHLVDDAAQDCFIIAHRRLHTCSGAAAVRGWMYGIARRVAKDYRRAISRRGPHTELDEDATATTDDAESQLARRQLLARVERFLDQLSENDRALFVLSEIHELTAPEACDILQINLNTAYSRLRRMREALATYLDTNAGVDDGRD